MPNEAIALRVARYLNRHIAYFETALAAIEESALDTPEAIEAFVGAQAEREAAGAQLDAEQAALLKEWRDGAGAGELARGEIRALAARAGALAERLRRAYDAADAKALRAAAVVALQAKAVRRGAGVAKKFGQELQEDAGGYVDRQA